MATQEVLSNGAALRAVLSRPRRRTEVETNVVEPSESGWKMLEDLLDKAFRNVMGDDTHGKSG